MKTILFLFLSGYLALNILSAQNFTFSSKADLNSDNKAEIIKLERITNPNGFKLIVNNKEVIDEFSDGEPDGFKIIDIDLQDEYKEIAVHTSGPSDDDEYMIYWYDGENIILINHFMGWPVFNGNGIVYLDKWMGFWKCRDKMVFDKTTHVLNPVPQFAYYVGVKAKVQKGFPIYKETDLINKVATLSTGSEIELLICDKSNRKYFDHRFLIKSVTGLTGWSDLNTIQENTEGLPWAD